jgi:hypothetical protein
MAMAFTEVLPNDEGQILIKINGRNFSVEQDGDGYFLCEILPLDSLPENIRKVVERPVDPTRLVRHRAR